MPSYLGSKLRHLSARTCDCWFQVALGSKDVHMLSDIVLLFSVLEILHAHGKEVPCVMKICTLVKAYRAGADFCRQVHRAVKALRARHGTDCYTCVGANVFMRT